MKILTFTDIHGNENLIQELIRKVKSKKPDLIINSGDFTIFGDDISKILSRLNKLNIKMLVIPGNHEEALDLKKECDKFENIVYLHKGVYEIGDYAFFGHGTGGFGSRSSEFERISLKVEKHIKCKKVILITHQPPYNTKLDNLDYFGHAGNKSYKQFITKTKPILAISGHLHETFGEMDKIGKTILINPGPLGRIIEV